MYKPLATAIALLVGLSAVAQPEVPSSVRTVASAGYWKASGRTGTYRLLVVNEGFEHVSSRLFIQWVAEPTSRESEPTVISVVEAKLPNEQQPTSFDASLRSVAVGRVEVALSGVATHEPKLKVQAIFVATEPGVLSQARVRSQR